MLNLTCIFSRNPDDSDARQKAKILAEAKARKRAHRISTAVFDTAKEIIENTPSSNIEELGSRTLVTTLLPSILAHLPHLAISDPRVSTS